MSETAYLFVDTFAFEKLAQQPECRVGQTGAQMAGYESYLIEQWACERRINTVVAAYTGNSQHVVDVQVLYVPTDLSKWSVTTRSHFEELVRMHILPKQTPLGNMLVTSLSSLPSNLTLVSIPARFRTGLSGFIANENLKRLQVAGRAAVTSSTPSDSVLATFRRVYLTSSVVSGTYTVIELVTLMQIALSYFGLFPATFIDGLLCDITLKAISSWWSAFGRQRFRDSVPREQDKLYMRTSCCALIGVITGARQRLSALGLKPPKDPFDAESFVTCIKRFQKLEKLPRTHQLDDTTYFKLVQETAKLNTRSGTNVLTAMKSTVKEGLSGKVAEALADWETLDLDLLAKNIRGDRAKYIWQGKGAQVVPQVKSEISRYAVGKNSGIPLFSLGPEARSSHHHHHHHHHHHNNILHPQVSQMQQLPHNTPILPNQQDQVMHAPDHRLLDPHTGTDQVYQHSQQNSQLQLNQNNNFDTNSNGRRNSSLGNNSNPMPYQHSQKSSQSNSHSTSQAPYSSPDKIPPTSNPNFPFPASSASASSSQLHNPLDDDTKANFARWKWPSAIDAPEWSHPSNNTDSLPSEITSRNGSVGPEDFGSLAYTGDSMLKMGSYSPGEKQNRYQQPHLPDVMVSRLLTKDDTSVQTKSAATRAAAKLRRTASLGSVESTIFTWESLVPLAGLIKLYEDARGLQTELAGRMRLDLAVSDEMAYHTRNAEEKLVEVQRDNVLIQYHIHATTKKEESVRLRVKELEAFMARIDYELATLTVKLRDVDQSVMTFAAKVEATEARWKTMKQNHSQKRRGWFAFW